MFPVNSSTGGELAYHFQFFALAAIPLITVFGNVLVVVAVIRERHLKTSTNFLLVSLAIADLLVAICVMPFSIYLLVCNHRILKFSSESRQIFSKIYRLSL